MLANVLYLSKVLFCEAFTCVVVLHGRGESIDRGMAHVFADKLRSVLYEDNLTQYQVIEVGLSDDPEEDYYWSSFKSLAFQNQKLCKYLNQTVLTRLESNCTRIQLVGLSQGGLLMRALLQGQCLDSVVTKLDKLITIGAPNNGIFGVPDCSQLGIKDRLTMFACRLLEGGVHLSAIGPSILDAFIFSSEDVLSFASYWNSPSNSLTNWTFLAHINNQNNTSGTKTKYLSQKLNAFVMISFEKESIVLPPITASFGSWDAKGVNYVTLNETDLYANDLIGLKTLDQNKGLIAITIANSSHMHIPLEFIRNQFIDLIK